MLLLSKGKFIKKQLTLIRDALSVKGILVLLGTDRATQNNLIAHVLKDILDVAKDNLHKGRHDGRTSVRLCMNVQLTHANGC